MYCYYFLKHEYYGNVTLAKQAQELESILCKTFPKCANFDIIAFSLGARIALATVALFPTLIRKAALTGVGLDRSPYAKIVIYSWKDMLLSAAADSDDHSSSLKAFAWSIIMTTYSQSFLGLHGPQRIVSWVDHICDNNNQVGILKLLEQTHGDPIMPTSCTNEMLWIVDRVKKNYVDLSHDMETKFQFHIGEHDALSTVEQASELNTLINRDESSREDIVIYKACGHAVMNEDGRSWRKNVLDYLKS